MMPHAFAASSSVRQHSSQVSYRCHTELDLGEIERKLTVAIQRALDTDNVGAAQIAAAYAEGVMGEAEQVLLAQQKQ